MDKRIYSISISIAIAAVFTAMALSGVMGAAATRFSDFLYAGGTPMSDIVIVAIDDASIQKIGRWPWPRDVFANALPIFSEAEVVGIDVSFFEASSQSEDKALADAIASSNVVLTSEYSEFSGSRGTKLLSPIFESGTGFVNVYEDSDGIVREIPTHIEGQGVESLDSFSVKLAESWLGSKPNVTQRMLINYFGTYRKISFSDATDKSAFKDKIVIIGATAKDLHDEQLTPIGLMSGAEIHANAIQTMLTRRFLQRQSSFSVALVIFILSIIASIATTLLRLRYATPAVAAIAIAYFFFSMFMFDSGTVMNLLHPLAALCTCYVAVVALKYASEAKQRRWITSVFGMYMSKEVVSELLKNPSLIKLGGRKKNVTVLFSDIRGFTSISEKLSPEQLVAFLNEYFTAMTDVIMKTRGVVDKYIGDAVMAFWGAPLDEPDHAKLACEAALGMTKRLDELKVEWSKNGLEINIGIGLNTGDVVVGNMGSDQRFDYTVIGDSVNLASRLEELNKEYATRLIISEDTLSQAGDFFARELDYVKVKGKNKPVKIFELIAKAGEETEKQKKIKTTFESGLALYRQIKFSHATSEFEKAVELGDATAKIFIERCHQLSKEHLPTDWDGVFVAKSK